MPLNLLHLFADNLLPVLLASAAGWALRARARIDPAPVARMAFYLLSPCLIFDILLKNRMAAGDFLHMAGFTFASLLILGVAAALLARWRRWERPVAAAVVLGALLPNAGNFGLAANLFAFGDAGLAQASLFFVASAVLSYTVGVFVAGMGRAGVRESIAGLYKVPAVWAVALGALMVNRGWELPLPVARTVSLFSDACIPVFLLVLGMQLHGAKWKGRGGPLLAATGLRLLGGTAVALGLTRVLHFEGAAFQAAVFQASMPTAVIAIILATEYDAEPEFVTSVVFLTTVLSPLTLTPLLAWLKA